MEVLSRKLKQARAELGMSQRELAELAEVSVMSIQYYEMGRRYPRQGTMLKLAVALHVSFKYLSDDSCYDPKAEIEMDTYLLKTQKRYGSSLTADLRKKTQSSGYLFAGGRLSPEDMELFFNALVETYLLCKEAARRKFGRKTA